MSDEPDDIPMDGVVTPPFRKPVVEPVAVQEEEVARHPAEQYREEVEGSLIRPEDHFKKVPNVPFTVPVTRKNRLVARHEMEGTPVPGNNTDSSASGQGTGGGGGGGETNNAQNIQIIFDMLDCFEITCNEDGTLSWSFDCDDGG